MLYYRLFSGHFTSLLYQLILGDFIRITESCVIIATTLTFVQVVSFHLFRGFISANRIALFIMGFILNLLRFCNLCVCSTFFYFVPNNTMQIQLLSCLVFCFILFYSESAICKCRQKRYDKNYNIYAIIDTIEQNNAVGLTPNMIVSLCVLSVHFQQSISISLLYTLSRTHQYRTQYYRTKQNRTKLNTKKS